MKKASRPYFQIAGLENVYFEDSYVLSIAETNDRVAFKMEIVLTEDHPLYASPNPGEKYCYRLGILMFNNVTSRAWIQRRLHRYSDATGEGDLGNIDSFFQTDRECRLSGDWGEILIYSDPPTLVFDRDNGAQM